jgi:hypothetical protein
MSSAQSSPVAGVGAASEASVVSSDVPASSPVAGVSSPAIVDATSTPRNPGTPSSAAQGTPSSARRAAGMAPSPRSDLGRRAPNLRNDARADGNADSSSENPRTLIWGTRCVKSIQPRTRKSAAFMLSVVVNVFGISFCRFAAEKKGGMEGGL